jgi:polyisoprenoid-binding protein YceI
MSSSAAERPAAREMRRWVVDPERSTVEFSVKHVWGLSTVSGRFARFDGTYIEGDYGASIELDVDAASLDTGNKRRDRHLRDIAFFHVEQHPRVRFTSDDVRELGDGKRGWTANSRLPGGRLRCPSRRRAETAVTSWSSR